MEKYSITLSEDKDIHHFEVAELPDDDSEWCKLKVFEDGKFVTSFKPDRHHILHVCQNPGAVSEGLLHLLADQIEARSHGFRHVK